MEKTKLKTRTYWSWKIQGREVVICVWILLYWVDQWAVVGEKISEDQSLYQTNSIFNDFKSGGARMMVFFDAMQNIS
jgi:hypothetical protein